MATVVTNFTSTTTWTAPAGVTSVTAECWGGGGGGGGYNLIPTGGASGGAGGSYSLQVVSVTPGVIYTVTVGIGGSGGAAGGAGSAGGDSWFSSSAAVLAKGGAGALANGNAAGFGSTTGNVGSTVYKGGDGGQGYTTYSGAGGGGAGNLNTGSNASTIDVTAGAGGPGNPEGGTGGTGRNSVVASLPGDAGNVTSGGGGGGWRVNGQAAEIGGDGARGYVRLTYQTIDSQMKFMKWISSSNT